MTLPVDADLLAAVRRNCDISDARHARGMSMCNYLLEMREYFRWEQGLAPGEVPQHAEVGRWLAAREKLWNDLDDRQADYAPLPIGAILHDPFATDSINAALEPHGVVYGAGVGRYHKPHFFLAALVSSECREGVNVVVSGREYARDMNAVPAALQRDTVFLRREALQRWLWASTEAWTLQARNGAIGATLTSYAYRDDSARAVECMVEDQSRLLILHELGEHAARRWLGPDWEDMLTGFSGRRAEILARAVRDNLADCLSTLPKLLDHEDAASLNLWFANFEGMRRALFPRLGDAYQAWSDTGDRAALRHATVAGATHWQAVAQRLLDLHRERGAGAEGAIEELAGPIEELAL